MDDTEDKDDAEAGAEVLQKYFHLLGTDCVRYHVDAKRYLCATRPSYFERLSDASKHSLNLQGGPMNDEEIRKFEKNPNLKEIIAVYVPDKEILGKLTLEHDLINDLKINSAHIVDIVLDVEEKYDIMIEDDAIMEMVTIGQAIEVIYGKVQEK